MGLIQIQKMSWPRCRMWFRYWRSSFLLCRFSQFEGWTSELRWECSRGQRAWCMAQWWPGPAGPSPSPSPSSTKTQASLEHQGQVSLHPAHHCHCQVSATFPWSLSPPTSHCSVHATSLGPTYAPEIQLFKHETQRILCVGITTQKITTQIIFNPRLFSHLFYCLLNDNARHFCPFFQFYISTP